MYLTMMPRALLDDADLLERLIDCRHPRRRVLQVHGVAEGELVADPIADKFTPYGSLEDALVELKHALESISVSPRRHHMSNRDALVLEMHWNFFGAAIGVLYLPHHALDVLLVEEYPLIVVLHPLGVCRAP